MELLTEVGGLAASIAINIALLTEGESPNFRTYAELTRLKATSPTFNHTLLCHSHCFPFDADWRCY